VHVCLLDESDEVAEEFSTAEMLRRVAGDTDPCFGTRFGLKKSQKGSNLRKARNRLKCENICARVVTQDIKPGLVPIIKSLFTHLEAIRANILRAIALTSTVWSDTSRDQHRSASSFRRSYGHLSRLSCNTHRVSDQIECLLLCLEATLLHQKRHASLVTRCDTDVSARLKVFLVSCSNYILMLVEVFCCPKVAPQVSAHLFKGRTEASIEDGDAVVFRDQA
jgi:hypothetical protein